MDQYKVSPSIADDIKQASFWAVLGSLVVVFLYILFRFKRWQFSLGAVAAVFHDVINRIRSILFNIQVYAILNGN